MSKHRSRPLTPEDPRPGSTRNGWRNNVVDLASVRRRGPIAIDGRQAIVLALVEQLSALLRGTTSSLQAAAVRQAASKALDVLDRVDAGQADAGEAQRAFREVEAVLARQHH